MSRGFSWIDARRARALLRRVTAPPAMPSSPPPSGERPLAGRSVPASRPVEPPHFEPPDGVLVERIEALCDWVQRNTQAQRTFLADEYGLMVAGVGEPQMTDAALVAPLMRAADEAATVLGREALEGDSTWGVLYLGAGKLLHWFGAEGEYGRFALGLVRGEPLSTAWMQRLHEALTRTLTEAQ